MLSFNEPNTALREQRMIYQNAPAGAGLEQMPIEKQLENMKEVQGKLNSADGKALLEIAHQDIKNIQNDKNAQHKKIDDALQTSAVMEFEHLTKPPSNGAGMSSQDALKQISTAFQETGRTFVLDQKTNTIQLLPLQERPSEQRKEPKTHGERLEQIMKQGMEDFNKGDFLGGVRAGLAFIEYIRRGLDFKGPGLNESLTPAAAPGSAPGASPEGGPKTPEQVRESEADTKLREEIRKPGSSYAKVENETKAKSAALEAKLNSSTEGRPKLASLRGAEATMQSNVETAQAKLASKPDDATFKKLVLDTEAALKKAVADREKVERNIKDLEAHLKESKDKLARMTQLNKQAEETKSKVEETRKSMQVLTNGIKKTRGFPDAENFANFLAGFSVDVDPTSKIDIQASFTPNSQEFLNMQLWLNKYLNKVVGPDELGMDMGGKVTNPEKFKSILGELGQKLAGKEREETSKRKKAKKAGEDFLGEKHANQLGDAFVLKRGALEAVFQFNQNTGVWQWKAPGQDFINVPQDFFPGTHTEATFLNDVANELHKKTS